MARKVQTHIWLCPYNYDKPFDEIHEISLNVLMVFLPFSSLSVFINIGIVFAVRRSKRNKALNKSTSSSKESSITSATILVTTSFIGFQTPVIAYDFFWVYWEGEITKYFEQLLRLVINLVILLESANYCFNSYLYVLPCKRLRKEMFGIILCRRAKSLTEKRSAVDRTTLT
jgi:hypothetical protein